MDFEYHKPTLPDDCVFRISPSQIAKFFSHPSVWYRDEILGEKSFTGSTASVLGTIVHAIAESYVKKEATSREEVEAYLTDFVKKRNIMDDPIDLETIRNAYPDMAMTLINDYIKHNMPTEVEQSIYMKLIDGIYVAGHYDNYTGDCVVDYKTHSSATEPKAIPFHYKIQCLAYAYMLRNSGVPIARIRLVYVNRPIDTRSISEKTGKPIGKLTPPRVTELTEVITPEDWELIEHTLTLMAETVILSRSNPELTHLLFKSMKLKGL